MSPKALGRPQPGRSVTLADLAAFRLPIASVVLAFGAVLGGGEGDWGFFAEAGRTLIQDHDLGLYVERPDLQTGPATLILAGLLDATSHGFALQAIGCVVLGIVVLAMIDRMADAGPIASTRCLFGMLCVAVWWPMFGAYGHLDDALVVSLGVAAVFVLDRDHRLLAGGLLGLAVATKPWAVILLPVLIPRRDDIRRSVRGTATSLAAAVLVGSLFWLPILLAHPESMGSLQPTVLVAYDSGLRDPGLAGTGRAEWFRIAQLGIAAIAATRATWLGERHWVMFAGIAIRVASDPGTWPYYTAGIVLAAFIWDSARGRGVLPIWTLACLVALPPTWLVPFERVRGFGRLGLGCAAVIAPEVRRMRGTGSLGERLRTCHPRLGRSQTRMTATT